MPPPIKITSFWHAIYKRLWSIGTRGDAHVSTEIASDGNFSLETTSPGNGNGIFGTTNYGAPLAAGDFVAAHNPLWVILNATVPPSPPPMAPDFLVPVPPGNAMWLCRGRAAARGVLRPGAGRGDPQRTPERDASILHLRFAGRAARICCAVQ